MRVNWAHGVMFFVVGLVVGYAGLHFDQSRDSGRASEDPTDILAIVGDSEISAADVEAIQPAEFMRIRQETYDVRAQTLETAISLKLIDLEAQARNMEAEDLVRLEIHEKVSAPSEEDIAAFYQERRLQGTLEQHAPQISSYLRDQAVNTRSTVFLAELEARFPVERRLDPMRMVVASEGFPSKGPDNAPVTIVEFSDFQCPYCRSILTTLDEVESAYGDQVRFVFRQFPLVRIHPEAETAAQASLCANEQGMFWEMHDAMFEAQHALQVDQLKATARTLGLEGSDFDECIDSRRYAETVAADLEAGQAVGVRGTPMIFINGRALSGAKPFDEVAAIIDDELRRAGY